jgi:murein DD-endopeptidase MepM/ murein hydrolase activator NlpD
MSSTFADKVIRFIKILFAKVPEIITDFRIEKLSRLSKKTIAVIGAVTLTVIVICGAFVLSGGEEPENASLLTALQTEEQEEQAIHYYAINIDDVPVAALSTQEEAQAVLDSIVAHFSTKGSEIVSVAYKEKVGIVEGEAVDPVVMSVEDATNMIITGTKEPKVYTVESGDCLWDIAVKNGMSVEELISSNPDADVQHLKIGSTLNLYELKPYVHVSLTERATTTERIDYDIIYEETGTLYKGEIKVKTAGVYGKREVTKEIVKENGVAVSTTEISSAVISEPSTQVNLKGTKSLATLVGTGSFVSPMGYLEISSSYGSRGGGRHTGVDLRNPKGTPVYAVDDGVVVSSGYSGSYGNLVKLSHGNGIETWYAHCDTLLVSVGAVVKKGQQIATVGITGRATGYHLHFEVRKNGVPQNPMKLGGQSKCNL